LKLRVPCVFSLERGKDGVDRSIDENYGIADQEKEQALEQENLEVAAPDE